MLLVGVLLFGCGTFKVGGLPDMAPFDQYDAESPHKPFGGSLGLDWKDKRDRPHQFRVFGAMTPPETWPFQHKPRFYFGFWWHFDF